MSKKKNHRSDTWKNLNELASENDSDAGAEQKDNEPSNLEFPTREQLENQLTTIEQQVADYKEKALIAHAELENVRKRAERDVQNARLYANETILVAMLPIIDSLIRATQKETSDHPQVQSMCKGIALTLDLFEKTLAKFGIEVIDPKPGETFNPEQHEAMSMRADIKAKSNTVLEVLQKGYCLHSRVIRAAMVVVAQ